MAVVAPKDALCSACKEKYCAELIDLHRCGGRTVCNICCAIGDNKFGPICCRRCRNGFGVGPGQSHKSSAGQPSPCTSSCTAIFCARLRTMPLPEKYGAALGNRVAGSASGTLGLGGGGEAGAGGVCLSVGASGEQHLVVCCGGVSRPGTADAWRCSVSAVAVWPWWCVGALPPPSTSRADLHHPQPTVLFRATEGTGLHRFCIPPSLLSG